MANGPLVEKLLLILPCLVTEVISLIFRKKYTPPVKKEGFSEIVKVNCVPKFTDSKLEDLYRKFLIDK